MPGKKLKLTEKEWKERLTPEQFALLRGSGTEPAGIGRFNKHQEDGTYICAGCKAELFSSKVKYDSGSGWPAFREPASKDALDVSEDLSMGMKRVEVRCARCGGHLGHVFDDGPDPTGQRYCINSGALDFQEKSD